MSPKGKLFIVLAVAALAVPVMASAQQAYGQPQDPQSYGPPQSDYGPPDPTPSYGPPQPGYGQDQGPGPGARQMQGGVKHGHQGQVGVYPQFRAMEKHIRVTVREERQANSIEKRDAHRLMARLHQIQSEELATFQAHGVNLPPDVQARIQGELAQLAQTVDQSRGQERQGQAFQGQQ